ncbi:MAG: hypothetical protein ABI967_00275 [bacterium]
MTSKLIQVFLATVLLGLASTALAQTSSDINKPNPAASLSDSQKQQIKSIQTAAARKARPLTLRLAATVKRVYQNMLADKPDERLRQVLSRRMHATAGELLTIKGQSIRDSVNVLTPQQKELVRQKMTKPGAPGDLLEVIERTFRLNEK